jgi:hypothetical protein
LLRGKVLTPKGHPSVDRLESERLTRGQVGRDAVLGNLRRSATFVDRQNSHRIRDIGGNSTTRKATDFDDYGTEPFQIDLRVAVLDDNTSSSNGNNHVVRLLGPDVSEAILEDGVTEIIKEIASSGEGMLAQEDSAIDISQSNDRGWWVLSDNNGDVDGREVQPGHF